MGMIGMQELHVIAAIAMLIFVPRQLPKLGRAAGETLKEFRNIGKTLETTKDELEDELQKDVKF